MNTTLEDLTLTWSSWRIEQSVKPFSSKLDILLF